MGLLYSKALTLGKPQIYLRFRSLNCTFALSKRALSLFWYYKGMGILCHVRPKEKTDDMSINYTHQEELWNTWSHAAGIAAGVIIGVLLLVKAAHHPDVWAVPSVVLYLFGMLGSYITSTSYHSLSPLSRWKERLRRWDHSAIYWHIAGSYSPITLIALRHQGYWGWGLFTFVWLCAISGTTISQIRLKEHSNLETCCYIGMGLSVLVAFKPLSEAVTTATLLWIIGEGVCYITGAVFYTLHRLRNVHTVFHFFVLAGTACHIVAVWKILEN